MDSTNTQNQHAIQSIHAGLVIGDIVALVLFMLIGEVQHGLLAAYNPLLRTLEQAAMIGAPWLLLAWLLGAYRHQVLTSWRGVGIFLLRTALAWLFAVPLGLVVRAWIYQSPTIIMLFVNAALLFGGAVLLSWRSVYALISLVQYRKQSTALSAIASPKS